MRALVILVAAFIGFATVARAADDNVAAGQAVIRSQEEAISRDDATTAYSFAAPAIASQFPSPEVFMFMVRNGYTPVYRHKSFEFGVATVVDGKIKQDVHIVDDKGVEWEALYTLEQQPDGSLKISGCVLTKSVGA